MHYLYGSISIPFFFNHIAIPAMKHLNKLAFILLLTVMTAIAAPVTGLPGPGNPLYTLYPPLNFVGAMVECSSYLHWDKPQLPNGTVPAGLVGYYLYRDGVMRHYFPSGDSLSFYDYGIDYGAYIYTITANYDLTAYGVPGQFGESPTGGGVSMTQNCDVTLPFYEPWDMGTFSFQNWHFQPNQGNWNMDVTQGNPLPAAVFRGLPAVEDYDVTMESLPMPATPWICAAIYLEFDYKLADISADGTQKLVAMYYVDNTWFPALEITNLGTTGWIHEKVNISQVSGKRFRLGFKAKGTFTDKISSWSVDNIKVTPVCKGPAGSGFTKTGNTIHLTWQHPPCDSLQGVTGYNVYRTSEYGVPPYTKLNLAPVTGLEYTDVVTSSIPNGLFRYYITDLQKDLPSNTILCEAAGDTLVVDFSLGVETIGNSAIRIYLNASNNLIVVKSDTPVESCEVFNILGHTELTLAPEKRSEFTIPVTGLKNGVYLVKIKNASGNVVRKVSLMH
ncbi:MAG: T9SS type A sorting domain-containing protein [Bacteroidales bacterium]